MKKRVIYIDHTLYEMSTYAHSQQQTGKRKNMRQKYIDSEDVDTERG